MKCDACGKFRKRHNLREVYDTVRIGDIHEFCQWCRPDLFTIASSIKAHGWRKTE